MIIGASNHLHDACNRYFVNGKIKYFVRVRNRFLFRFFFDFAMENYVECKSFGWLLVSQ